MLDDLMSDTGRSFTTRWRGYDREQVEWAFAVADQDVALACLDRDAALSTAQEVTRQLESLRSEIAVYRLMHAGYPDGSPVAGCLRYVLHMARLCASSIEDEARRRAEALVRDAEDLAARQASLLDEVEQECRRRLAEATSRAERIALTAEVGSAAPGVGAPSSLPSEGRGSSPDVRVDVPVPRDREAGTGRHALRSGPDASLTTSC